MLVAAHVGEHTRARIRYKYARTIGADKKSLKIIQKKFAVSEFFRTFASANNKKHDKMEKYNYREVMAEDIRRYIFENNISGEDFETAEDAQEKLHDMLWAENSVTGNGSGSYFCNAYEAEEAIAHNWDLLKEACEEFGVYGNPIERGAEWADVTIRCYLLGRVLFDVVTEMWGVD